MPEEISGCENAISPFSSVTTLAAIAAVRSTGSLVAASTRPWVGAEHSAATWRAATVAGGSASSRWWTSASTDSGTGSGPDGDRVTLPRQRPPELECVERVAAGHCMDALKGGPCDGAVQLLVEHPLDRAEAEGPQHDAPGAGPEGPVPVRGVCCDRTAW